MLLPALGSIISALFLAQATPEIAASDNDAKVTKAYATPSLISPAPGAHELRSGFLNSLNKQYPTRNCPSGFRSNLRKFPQVEICVTYSDFRGICKRLRADAFSCQVAFSIAVNSPTHPKVFDKLERTSTEIEREDFVFTHDWRGWRWKADAATVDALVPAEFRGRSPFARADALAN